jgi:hypothetical protein
LGRHAGALAERGRRVGITSSIAGRVKAAKANLSEVTGNDIMHVLGRGAEAPLPRWPAVPNFAGGGPGYRRMADELCGTWHKPGVRRERLRVSE